MEASNVVVQVAVVIGDRVGGMVGAGVGGSI